jgi:OOP family OmpA-OmpF porin
MTNMNEPECERMKKLVMIACLAGAMGNVFAQAYVGGTIGQSGFDVDCGALPSCDKTDTAFKVYGGYNLPTRVVPGLAVEVAYIDFGQAKASGFGVSNTLSASALAVNAAIRFDFSPAWHGVGRLGFANVDASTSGSVGPFSVGGQADSAFKLYFGLGLVYSLNKNFKVVGALDFTEADLGNQSSSLRAFSAGAQYSF